MALNAFQKAVQALAKSKGLKGDAERQIYSTPEYQQLLKSFYGDIQLPAGVDESQVISRDSNQVTYKDAEGYTHRLGRNLNGESADLGRVTEESTDRPAVLPVTKQTPGTEQAIQQALGVLGNTFGANTSGLQPSGQPINGTTPQGNGALGSLSPADEALFNAMLQDALTQLDRQSQTAGGNLVAQLYSRGINESSLANDAVGRLNEGLLRARGGVLADDASRRLETRKFLTDLSTKSALELFNSIMGNDTTRSVSSGQIGLGRDELDQRAIDSARQYQIEQQKIELQKKAQSPWRSILSAVASVGASAIPGLSMLSSIGGGFNLGKAGKAPIGGDGGYG